MQFIVKVALTAIVVAAIAELAKRSSVWAAALAALPLTSLSADGSSRAAADRPAIRLAIIGDSDSHSYQDTVWFPIGHADRGGSHRATTLQWTEILDRLRAGRIDLGPWGRRGMRGAIAAPLRSLGFSARSPRKEDFGYNFAFSGAGCDDLLAGRNPQTIQLASLIAAAPAAWRNAIVVIRIGINSIGRAPELRLFAAHGATEQNRQRVQRCTEAIRDSIATLRQRQSELRFVVVGIFDNSNWPPYFGYWPTAAGQSNIRAVLDAYDGELRGMSADPRVAFFDDRAWFARHWGNPETKQTSSYQTVTFGERTGVTNSQGDSPVNAVLADGHAGTAWNALWAAELVQLLNRKFDTGITPLHKEEMTRLINPSGAIGLR